MSALVIPANPSIIACSPVVVSYLQSLTNRNCRVFNNWFFSELKNIREVSSSKLVYFRSIRTILLAGNFRSDWIPSGEDLIALILIFVKLVNLSWAASTSRITDLSYTLQLLTSITCNDSMGIKLNNKLILKLRRILHSRSEKYCKFLCRNYALLTSKYCRGFWVSNCFFLCETQYSLIPSFSCSNDYFRISMRLLHTLVPLRFK